MRTRRRSLVSFVVAAALAAFGVLGARAQQAPAGPSGPITVIHCGALLATPGQPPMGAATVVVQGGMITRVERGHIAPAQIDAQARLVDLSDMFVLPGLIDCHTHITFEMGPGARFERVIIEDADATMHGATFARRTLEAGFTTIRNVGSVGRAAFALRDGIDRGDIPGPRILCSGQAITPTGGHGDSTHGFREDIFEMPSAMQGVADGADECRKAVRAQVKRGADVIKITATGGVLSPTKAGLAQQFFEDELTAIVTTAHMLGRKVAAHAHGTDGLNAALRAGVDSIEHGSFLDDESISLFKQSGAYLVPTLLAGATVTQLARSPQNHLTPEVTAKALAAGPVMQQAFARAYKAGVKIAFGTDSGVSRHGENAKEFDLMVEAGMPAAEAIRSATVSAADLCGLLGEVGTIEVGKRADIIATAGSPIEDVTRLHDVGFVMARGVVHKHNRAE